MTTDSKTLEALNAFVAAAQSVIDAHMAKNFPTLEVEKLHVEMGRRYAKIVRERATDKMGRSVYCFVDLTNGDVLKAETWKKPAKHPRGNIFNPDSGATGVNPYGANYMR